MFDEKIGSIIQRIPELIEHLQTEEATKNALVLPFIQALGYDVFNPLEVVPEYTADVGIKKGEKVDYAILRDGEVIIMIECKKVGTNLGDAETSQLYRYFSTTKARLGILTNGIQYWFYSDLDAQNRMDEKPFLELDLSDPRAAALREVKKLAKNEFDLDKLLDAANELKFTSEFQKILTTQLKEPDDEFVRFLVKKAQPGCLFTATIKERYTPLVVKAFQQLISDKITERLKIALTSETKPKISAEEPKNTSEPEVQEKDGIITTEEELEGFRIVRAITCRVVPLERVTFRDTKSYFGILLDANNRKPICRLWFNTRQKYLGVFDADRNETKIPIDSLPDIYKYTDQIIAGIEHYENPDN